MSVQMARTRTPAFSPIHHQAHFQKQWYQLPISAAKLYGHTLSCLRKAQTYNQQADFPPEVTGSVALISRGTCPFGQKSALAGAAGADAALIYDNIDEPALAGTLGAPPRPEGPYVPTAGITLAQGTALLAAINGGTAVTADVNIVSIMENRTT